MGLPLIVALFETNGVELELIWEDCVE